MKIKTYKQTIHKGEMRPSYCIFNRNKNGDLIALMEHDFSMGWSKQYAATWKNPPSLYFNPKRGDFIIKTTKSYKDIKMLGYSGNRSNLLWKEIK